MDEHKVTLSLDIKKLKRGFNEASGMAKQFSDRVKQDFKGISDALSFRARVRKENIGQVKKEIELLKSNLKKDLDLPVSLRMSETERGQLKSDLQYAEKQLERLENQANKTSGSVSQIGKSGKNIGGEISKSFSKGLKSVKRLTLGFLGARAAFGLFRKYLSEYQSQNEEFANKMQLTTSVITNALAPAFEFFGNVIQYAVIGLARIIELLTGVNILGKTVDNSFKGASKSAKEFNDNLSGLDEISNIQEDSGGLSTGIGSQLNALNEFQKKISEVDAWLEKTGIKKWLEKLKPIIKDVFGWISEHPLQTLGLLGGIKMLTSLLPGLLGSAGAGTGLLGLNQVLLGLASIGIIAISIKLIWDASKETKEVQDNVSDMAKSLGESFDGLFEHADEGLEAFATDSKSTTDQIASFTKNSLDNVIAEYGRMEEKWNKPFTNIVEHLFTNTHKLSTNFFQTNVKSVKGYVEQIRNAYKNGLLTPDDVENYKKLLGQIQTEINSMDVNTIKNYLGPNSDSVKSLKDLKKYINDAMKETDQYVLDFGSDVNKIMNKKYTLSVNVNVDTKNADNNLNNFVNKWQNNLNNKLSLGSGLRLPSYDVGTAYVPRDQIAMIHEGERIIPKQYNNADYLGQLGNSETNMLLMELNRSILEFANRPQTLNVNGKELAKVTYGDFQEESSRRGTNTSIRRV